MVSICVYIYICVCLHIYIYIYVKIHMRGKFSLNKNTSLSREGFNNKSDITFIIDETKLSPDNCQVFSCHFITNL